MIPGDGVGPELMSSVRAVFSAAAVPVDFEEIIARSRSIFNSDVIFFLEFLKEFLVLKCLYRFKVSAFSDDFNVIF